MRSTEVFARGLVLAVLGAVVAVPSVQAVMLQCLPCAAPDGGNGDEPAA